jgi:ubiquinone/menaquinone biosynthesis C-methylase UbiE
LIDDPSLWSTPKSDAVEREALSLLLQGAPTGRILEVGAGTGRWRELLAGRFRSVVAIDRSRDHLVAFASSAPAEACPALLVADGHRLPFTDGSFSAVLLVRVHHLSPAPERLLSEIRRVLAPGGVLVLSYYPTPSWKTWQHRFWQSVHANPRSEEAGLGAVSPPTIRATMSARSIERTASQRGFRIEERLGTGLEELSVVGRLPVAFFVGLLRALPVAWGYPTRFALLRAV